MRMVEVPPSRRMWRRVGIMYALGAPFMLIAIVSVVDAKQAGDRLAFVGLLLVMLSIPLLHFASRGTWVRRFDARGVTTYRGRCFEWKDFQRVDAIKRRRYYSHRELVFATGRVIVPPAEMVANPSELADIVAELERGQNRFTT